jgi:hypothetical protein
MNAQARSISAAARWRWTCAALAAAATLGTSVDAPAESAVVTVSSGGSRSAQPGGSASARVNFQVVIPPRMEWDLSQGLKASSNLKGKVQMTVDNSGVMPVHTVSVP